MEGIKKSAIINYRVYSYVYKNYHLKSVVFSLCEMVSLLKEENSWNLSILISKEQVFYIKYTHTIEFCEPLFCEPLFS